MALLVAGIEVAHCPTANPETAPDSRYAGFQPGVTILPQGHKKHESYAAFKVDTIFERDIPVPMRDGIVLRADVFRPAEQDARKEKVPVVLAWSPYGKSGTGFYTLDMIAGRIGVPQSHNSGYEKFEGPDPAEWTARGYAICNIDARGAFDSEGDLRWWGSAEGRDGHDAIEHLAQLDWCNGSIALMGNSWLAVAQWFIAAERPPHLKCIAPLEGMSDFYREFLARGGVPSFPFAGLLQAKMFGRNQQEDVLAMYTKYPAWSGYWEDKRAKFSQISVPAYVLASFSTGFHTEGSFRAFEELQGPKWLRVLPTQEWHDLYKPETVDDLQCFVDRYTKGLHNGWEKTPPVRMSILRFNMNPIVHQPFREWPLPGTRYEKYYLNATQKQLSRVPPKEADTISYPSDVPAQQVDNDLGELFFEYTCTEACYLIGYSRAVLYVSCPDNDDMDVFVQLRKADRQGQILRNINIPLEDLGMDAEKVPDTNALKYLGPTGIVRASHRKLDEKLSTERHPVLSHRNPEKIPPGKIVKLEIGLWPTSIFFDKGEKLVLKVSGHHMTLAEFEVLRGTFSSGNQGQHIVHAGPEHPSMIQVPFVSL